MDNWRLQQPVYNGVIANNIVPNSLHPWNDPITNLHTVPKQKELELEIDTLKKKIGEQANGFHELKQGSDDQKRKISELESDLETLRSKEQLRHLLDRVGILAQKSLLTSSKLFELFQKNEVCNAFVVSIDVRRSTDLMLKAREPKLFAEFITSLAEKLRSIILERYGIFDKFTGDGILAYFPDFYSGQDAGLQVVEASEACHQAFKEHYNNNRKCFLSIINDVGLGIGVDYGEVTIVRMHGELTVVGTPVVYGCRLGGANAGQTLVNQPAYEMLMENYSEYIDFSEASIDFKHEGSMLAYSVMRNVKPASPNSPDWVSSEEQSEDKN